MKKKHEQQYKIKEKKNNKILKQRSQKIRYNYLTYEWHIHVNDIDAYHFWFLMTTLTRLGGIPNTNIFVFNLERLVFFIH